MTIASNTKDVFRRAVGKKVIGLYFDRWSSELVGQVAVLVLDDGTGVAFADDGAHWTVTANDVAFRAHQRREELRRAEADLREVLALEAALPVPAGAEERRG